MKKNLFILTILFVAFFAVAPNVFAQEWCHTFNTNIQKGDSGDEVTALQTALIEDGVLNIQQPTGYFWTLTFDAVVLFQEKYASEILTPIGLSHGTGKVASATRAKLNELYGCGSNNPPIDNACTSSNWTYTLSPLTCPSSGTQTKTWTKIGACTGGVTHSATETASCTYQANTCTSFTYSDWASCSQSGIKTRTVTSYYPSGCTGGNPTTSQTCTYVPPTTACTSSNWTYTLSPLTCPSSGIQTKTWTKIGTCTGGVTHSATETIPCAYQANTCTSFSYSDWTACTSSGTKTRTVSSSYPSGCTGGNPTTSQTCTYVAPTVNCTESDWTYALSPSTCPSSGIQTKTWTKIGTCTGGATHTATETAYCNPPPTVDIKANNYDGPVVISNNTPVALTWTSSHTSSCVASGSWSGTKNTSGSESTSRITASQLYTVTCTGLGGTATDSVFVNPTTTFVVDIKANNSDGPVTVSNNSSATLTWSAPNANYCTISHIPCSSCGNSGPSPAASVSNTGSQQSAILFNNPTGITNSVMIYTLTCTGSGGSISDSVTIMASAEPYSPTLELKANGMVCPMYGCAQSIPIPSTRKMLLSWESTNANSCTASGNWSGSKVLVGSEEVTVPSTQGTFVYSLTCAGSDGTALKDVKVGSIYDTSAPGSGTTGTICIQLNGVGHCGGVSYGLVCLFDNECY